MAIHTLKAKYKAKDDSTSCVRHVFCASKDQKDIYYQFEDKPNANSEPDAAAKTKIPTPPPVAAMPAVVAPPIAPTTTAGHAISIEDVPICAVDILAIIDSQKLKKQLSEIPLSKSIKDLSSAYWMCCQMSLTRHIQCHRLPQHPSLPPLSSSTTPTTSFFLRYPPPTMP
jgi:hypothetical protein